MTLKTKIHISKKVESILSESLIRDNSEIEETEVERWNATLFYVSRKKCLLVTNSKTRYTVIVPGLSKNDFKELTKIFISSFYIQLEKDGIIVDRQQIEKMIGCIELLKTNNNKSIIGMQNSILPYLEDWKYEFGEYSNWDFYEIGRRINGIPYKQLEWRTPKEVMFKTINTSA